MSTWKAAEDRMSDDLTDEFGEPIRHFPMRKGDVNGRSETDPARPVQTMSAQRPSRRLQGIFEAMAYEAQINKGHTATTVVPATRVSSRKPCLSIERRDFVSDIIAGDLFALTERGTVYEVTDIQPDGQGRAILRLVQRGRHEIEDLAVRRPAPPIASRLSSTASIAATMRDLNGNDNFTVSLLHMDGVNNGSSFPDSNFRGHVHPWFRYHGTVTSTAEKKFGTASMLNATHEDETIAFPGFGRADLWANDHADWRMGSGDFTIDFWMKRYVITGHVQTLYWWNRLAVVLARDGTTPKISFTVPVNGTLYVVDGTTLITDTNWHHVAAARWGTTIGLFIDGVLEATGTVPVNGAADEAVVPAVIGNDQWPFGTSQFAGYIDEFRLSKGIARWTSNFTPPTAPYG